MSSHHIIRDQQEPALILENLDSFPMDLLGQLLEWAPFTVCGESALDQALKYEISLDMIYSNCKDSDELLGHFPGIKQFESSTDWLTNALIQLSKNGHKAVNIVTGEDFNDLDIMHQMSDRILVDVVTPLWKYVRVQKEFSKWIPANSRLQLHGDTNYRVTGGELEGHAIIVRQDGMVTIGGIAPFVIGLGLDSPHI